ncbi:hypothetical protein B9Q11_03970 [Candidatus Marsarchaeota G2 archaeon ECH_B_SAG-F08]|uniref:Uncharacterized protein n=4 Tax=Candidatus Marsarchaeota TaxID=1978152 RepID=A0A2R6AGL4_9ARCH|nr:MAG: hypothetical protein B9Q01_02345 [Candidatus Marsarchaeota G1 archaeon OSP_D]PSN85506.1 MAG: hypothetical protein B9Q02_06095 [Candidatus Marsarchaeota G1 archaeon BE_D]PSN89031.1 MAG: hypothetical protein B9Q00_02965 [Candidatus Marsarchaeota G1 archaeon OSP_C]PSN97550.1 MAG: hypothetical protein B9Q11_03970 [Candidatus Marsarchaeota G2 archaeon ECH_B_SAG-F08]
MVAHGFSWLEKLVDVPQSGSRATLGVSARDPNMVVKGACAPAEDGRCFSLHYVAWCPLTRGKAEGPQ